MNQLIFFPTKFRLLQVKKIHLIKLNKTYYLIGGLILNQKFRLSIIAVGGSGHLRT